jgi:hypothetical protein
METLIGIAMLIKKMTMQCKIVIPISQTLWCPHLIEVVLGLCPSTETLGSAFPTARIATYQIIDLRTTFRYLGVPVRKKSYIFKDVQTVTTIDQYLSHHLGKQ